MTIMTAKLENCFNLLNGKNVLSSSYIFTNGYIKKTLRPDFFSLVIYLKETEPEIVTIACVLFGKRWKFWKRSTWYGNLFCTIFFINADTVGRYVFKATQ